MPQPTSDCCRIPARQSKPRSPLPLPLHLHSGCACSHSYADHQSRVAVVFPAGTRSAAVCCAPPAPSAASQPAKPAVGRGVSVGILGQVDAGAMPTRPPPPPPVEQVRQSVAAAHPLSRFKLAAAAALLIALTSAITLAALRYMAAPVAADGMGTLVVQTNPSGASVDIDGQPRGVTPLSLDLSPGRHTLKLANEGNVRSMPITIAAGWPGLAVDRAATRVRRCSANFRSALNRPERR